MAYQINKTDGTVVATVADGQIDQLSTDITLIGKNYSGFGEVLNENFVKLLENFAGTTRPTHPIRGQIWFDVSELKLKVYSGTQFLPVSSATIATSQPTTLGVGDLWFNSVDKQLYFYDGTSPILLGPLYSASQGLSGLKVVSILDTENQTRVVTYLYTNGILLGIFSKDNFTPKSSIEGFTGSIIPGFNVGNLITTIGGVATPLKFNVTVTNSENLGGTISSNYIRKDTFAESMIGSLSIENDAGISLGSARQAGLQVVSGNVFLSNTAQDKNLGINVRRGFDPETAILINPATRTIDLYSGFPTSRVNISGDLTVEGNFVVNGSTTTVNTTTLSVEDKNIELAKTDAPSDELANGGGITLKGTTTTAIFTGTLSIDPTYGAIVTVGTVSSGTISSWMLLSGTDVLSDTYITENISGSGSGSVWKISKEQALSSRTITATKDGHKLIWTSGSAAWNSTEHVNLTDGKEYKINGVTVLTSTSLGPQISSIPGVSSFGKQNIIRVGPGLATDLASTHIVIENNRISTFQTNQNLEIYPNGTGNIVLNDIARITNLVDPRPKPVVPGDPDPGKQDAATREYVDDVVETRSLAFSMDLTDGKPNSYIITNILDNLAPPTEYRDGTIVRILCTILTNGSTSLDINPLISAGTSKSNFLTDLSGSSSPAVTNISVAPATVLAPAITTTRIIKEFQLLLGIWTFVRDVSLPP